MNSIPALFLILSILQIKTVVASNDKQPIMYPTIQQPNNEDDLLRPKSALPRQLTPEQLEELNAMLKKQEEYRKAQ